MKTEMIDWNKNLNLYSGRDLCKLIGNCESGLDNGMLDLSSWIAIYDSIL